MRAYVWYLSPVSGCPSSGDCREVAGKSRATRITGSPPAGRKELPAATPSTSCRPAAPHTPRGPWVISLIHTQNKNLKNKHRLIFLKLSWLFCLFSGQSECHSCIVWNISSSGIAIAVRKDPRKSTYLSVWWLYIKVFHIRSQTQRRRWPEGRGAAVSLKENLLMRLWYTDKNRGKC